MTANLRRLRQLFQKLEAQKTELMTLVRQLPPELYNKQPNEFTWSVAQAVNHIYLSETLSMAYLRKKLSFPDQVPPYSPRSILAVWVLRLYLHAPLKRKSPKAINMWGQQTILSASDLDTAWTDLRTKMNIFFEENITPFPNHLVYRHPFVGRLTFNQTLIFFILHLKHHFKQIRRILEQVKS